MIYLLGGRNNPAIRVIVGAVLVVAGIVIHGGTAFVAVGAVLIAWGGAQALKKYRTSRQDRVTIDGRTS